MSVSASRLRFNSLEGLRAIMAWWVVFGHIANLTGVSRLTPGYMSPLWNGTVAVNVFILLSGFVITHLQLSANRPAYGIYIARRAFRLWPAYLLALLPMIVIPALYAYPFVELPWHSDHAVIVERYASIHANTAPHVALHLAMLHGLVPGQLLQHADSSLLSPAWSLSLEWQFYLVAPLLVALMLRSRRWAIGVVAASGVVTIAFASQSVLTWDFRSFLPISIIFFAIGMVSRIYVREIASLLKGRRSVCIQVLLVMAALTFVDGMTDFTFGRELAMWFVAMYAVSNEIGTTTSKFGFVAMTVLSWRPLRHVGEISYSTYILHIPIICAWFWLFGKGDTSLSQHTAIAIGVTSIFPIYFLSLASHRIIEKPFMRFGIRITSPNAFPRRRKTALPVENK